MISVNEFKSDLAIEHSNDLWRIVEFQHVRPGRGSAFVCSKLKNLRAGAVQDYTFHSTEKINTMGIQAKPMQYLYNDDAGYVFMDMNTYEQLEIPNSEIERESKFLKESMEVNVIMYESETLRIDLPNTVDLEVAETEPGIHGDTSPGGGKPATMETDLVVDIPFFISAGNVLAINTSDGSYVSRVNE